MLKHLPTLALVAFCFAAVAFGETFTADKDFLLKQKKVFELFYLQDDASKLFPEISKIANSYNIAEPSAYTKEGVAEEFIQRFKYGTLPRNNIFSVFYPELLDEAVALFKLFYYAKDFDTLYKTAAWAHEHVNQGQYAYALATAIIHRADTKNIRLPNLNEVNPSLFYNLEIAPQVFRTLAETRDNSASSSETTVVIPVNYTGWYATYDNDHEDKLNYFREDVGLGNVYSITQLGHPFWLPAAEFGYNAGIRGEIFFLANKIQYARYFMERLSHGLDDVVDIDWTKPIPVGYQPNQAYHNGQSFPQRSAFSSIPPSKKKYLELIEEYESRIVDAIDSGIVIDNDGKLIDLYGPGGIQYLGNIVEGNADSLNKDYYGHYDAIARRVLGFSPEPVNKYQILPSALENYASSVRDPIFWSLIKKYVNFYDRYASKLPKYTYERLAFPEAKIESVEISELVTFFDNSDFLLAGQSGNTVKILTRQSRLNHKPVSFTIDVHSDKVIKAQVNVFLGPKSDARGNKLDISESYKLFLPLDHFLVDLKVGSNKIVRDLKDGFVLKAEDEPRGDIFYSQIVSALAGNGTFTYTDKTYGYPERYAIPKGTTDGLPLQFFFYVGPIEEKRMASTGSNIWGDRSYYDMQSQGFPLDRPPFAFNFTLPNFVFKDVKVFHQE